MKYKLSIALLLSGLFAASSSAHSVSSQAVMDITVEGMRRVPLETIKLYFPIKQGQDCSGKKLDEGIKTLMSLGEFKSVDAGCSGGKLLIKVIENPIIAQVNFEGNRAVKKKDVEKFISLKPGVPYSEKNLHKDLNIILLFHQRKGLQNAVIDPKIVRLSEGKVALIYKIKENRKAKIEKINFVGNEVFDSPLLMSVIKSRQASIFRIFSSIDLYDPERLDEDKEQLQEFYFNSGYPDFSVVNVIAELNQRKNGFLLTFNLNEGDKYTFGKVSINNSLENITEEDLRPLVLIKEGNEFAKAYIEATKSQMEKFLGDKGYTFPKITYEIVKDKKTKVASVVFEISEGYRFYINRINIKGNVRTYDKVIRRKLRVSESEGYSKTNIDRSKRRLEHTGYFSEVKITPKETNVFDKVDLDVEVKEQPTGSADLKLSYNRDVGLGAGISFSDENLFGTGRSAIFAINKAQRDFSISVGMSQPNFMGLDMVGSIRLFFDKKTFVNEEEEKKTPKAWDHHVPAPLPIPPSPTPDPAPSANKKILTANTYKTTTKGAVFGLTYEINDNLYHMLEYMIKLENLSAFSPETSAYLRALGDTKNVTSMIGHSLVYDRRNNFVAPTSGYYIKGTQNFAGVGGDAKFIQHELMAAYYYPVYKNSVILQLVGRAGAIHGLFGKKVRLLDNYQMGENYVRGFDVDGIGPRAYKLSDDGETKSYLDALGGKYYYAATVELNFPIGLPRDAGVYGAVFHDCGNLFGVDIPDEPSADFFAKSGISDEKKLRASYGVGIIWYSPMGLLRVDYGIAYRKTDFDQTHGLRITFGTTF